MISIFILYFQIVCIVGQGKIPINENVFKYLVTVSTDSQKCIGAIMNKDWVITSDHCQGSSVSAGDQTVEIERSEKGENSSGLLLLKLKTSLDLKDSKVSQARLAALPFPARGAACTVVGWTDEGLFKAIGYTMNRDTCDLFNFNVDVGQLCVRTLAKVWPCGYTDGLLIHCESKIVGLLSKAQVCGSGGTMTKVAHASIMAGWIRSTASDILEPETLLSKAIRPGRCYLPAVVPIASLLIILLT